MRTENGINTAVNHAENKGGEIMRTENRVNTVANHSQRKGGYTMKKEAMCRIKKAGIMTVSTAIAGVSAASMTVPAYAQEAVLEANMQTANQDLMTAKADYDQACSEAGAAEAAFEAAQADVETARQNYDQAVSEAQQAFADLQESAEQEDAAAAAAVTQAEIDWYDAQSDADKAQIVFDEKEGAKNAAEQAAAEAQENCPVTPDTIAAQETNWQENAAAAETAKAGAEQTGENAAAARIEWEQKQETEAQASAIQQEVEADYNRAQEAVTAAQAEVDQAVRDIQYYEGLKNGTIRIEDTAAYQESEEAKAVVEWAQTEADTAGQEKQQADADYESAKQTAVAAKETLDRYEAAGTEYEAALTKSMEEWGNAKAAAGTAQADRDLKQQEASLARISFSDAQAAEAEAETALAKAREEQASAEADADAADEEVAAIVARAGREVDDQLTEADSVIVAKREVLEETQRTLAAAEAKYGMGTIGFIDWMLLKEDLQQDQRTDLTSARKYLTDAMEEDFSIWDRPSVRTLPEERNDKVVVLGDEKDAVSLNNIQHGIDIMKDINRLRASDDNFVGELAVNPAGTNFYFMAVAQAGAMRGAELRRHSMLSVSCENLAWYPLVNSGDPGKGYGPNYLWYNSEKANFDYYKAQLGITTLTSRNQIKQIEAAAEKDGRQIGHYTNLFWAAEQVMGVGYTPYVNTSCFNASKASNYETGARQMHIYTIEEFEALYQTYCSTVDKTACEDAVAQAEADLTQAEAQRKSIADGRDAYVTSASQEDRENADALRQKAVNAAAVTEQASANAGLRSAERASAEEIQRSAETLLAEAEAYLLQMQTNVTDSELRVNENKAALEEALSQIKAAQTTYSDAQNAEQEAKDTLDAKSEQLKIAEEFLAEARAAYEEAAERLGMLTSSETLAALQESKTSAETKLTEASAEEEEKERILREAQEAAAAACEEVLSAEAGYQEAQAAHQEAQANYDLLEGQAEESKASLNEMREIYAPVAAAFVKAEEAKAEYEEAERNLKDAQERLAEAELILEGCRANQDVTAENLLRVQELLADATVESEFEDPEYDYLNGYTAEVRSSREAMEQMEAMVEAARIRTMEANTDKDLAYDRYQNALNSLTSAVAEVQDAAPSAAVLRNETDAKGSTVDSKTVSGSESKDTAADVSVSLGETGEQVALIQQRLSEVGYYDGMIDGEFGVDTLDSVLRFQQDQGLYADGVVDDMTLKMMNQPVVQLFSETEVPAAAGESSSVSLPGAAFLQYGMRGDQVKELQTKLIETGFLTGTADGVFGAYTYYAVRAFQEWNQIDVDGSAGPQTLRVLNDHPKAFPETIELSRVLKQGDIGLDVFMIQKRLADEGFLTSVPDGYFGEDTLQAVLKFQKEFALEENGTVDQAMIDALNGKGVM